MTIWLCVVGIFVAFACLFGHCACTSFAGRFICLLVVYFVCVVLGFWLGVVLWVFCCCVCFLCMRLMGLGV